MRVGGNQVLQARCRIIAATNRDLREMAKQGTFKEDLYYRLKVITLHVPPLRDRLPDIPLLANHFLQKINLDLGADVSVLQDGVMDRLMLHPWTGNVRELENALVEAIVRARGKVLLLEDLEKVLVTDDDLLKQGTSAYSLEEMEKRFIRKTLAEVGWSRTEAAKQLEISLPTLRKKILKYNIEFPDPG
jgi:two-component system response regulator AtoC